MSTFNDLINEVSLNLAGYTMRQDRSTHIDGVAGTSISSSATEIVIASGENIAKGLVEVGDELVWVDSFDRGNNTLVLAPYGRGFQGTIATSHPVGERVTIAPTFPRAAIKRAINDTILAVYPDLFGVGYASFTYTPARNTYALPSDAETVLAVSFESIGPSKEWMPVRDWRVDTVADIASFNSSSSLTIYSAVDPGRTVKVAYARSPLVLDLADDDFSLTTGLLESVKDVIVLGASYRLLSFIDPGRLTFSSPEADTQTGRIQFGSGTNTAKYVYALYQQRLQDEVRKLKKRYPVRVHFTR
jgi:hypothetical protein